jgi:hypothetical protein
MEKEALSAFRGTQQNRIRHLWILVVDAPERSGVEQKLVKSTTIHSIRVCRNRWFFHEDNFACDGGIYC